MTFYFHLLSLLLLTSGVLSQIVEVTPPKPTVGNSVTASCTGNLGSDLFWTFSMSGKIFANISEIPAYQLSNSSTATNQTVSWTIEFQLNIAGTYRCSAANGTVVSTNTTILSTGIIPRDFSTDVETLGGTSSFAIECRFQIAPPPVGPRATWSYQAYTFPSLAQNFSSLLNNSVVSPIVSFPNLTATNEYVSRLEIRNVLTANAGFYQCVIYAGDSEYTGGVRVRVRQQLDPLWPAVGIIIQLIIVVICIVLHYVWDHYKEKKSKEMRLKKAKQNLVTLANEYPLETEHQSNDLLIKVVPT